jgi:hypothetical protein
LTVRPSPEAHYVLGCLYYELNRDALAVRHPRKAIRMDARYVEAFHLLAQVYDRMGRPELAEQARQKTSGCATLLRGTGITTSDAKRVGKTAPLFHARKSGHASFVPDKRIIQAYAKTAGFKNHQRHYAKRLQDPLQLEGV